MSHAARSKTFGMGVSFRFILAALDESCCGCYRIEATVLLGEQMSLTQSGRHHPT